MPAPTLASRTEGGTSAFQRWFPVLPFFAYWIGTLLLFEFGPLVNDPLHAETYVYLLTGLACFAAAYAAGLAGRRWLRPVQTLREAALAYAWLRWTAPAALLGAAGLVLDRLLSGAGSFSRTLTETQYVREEFGWNTTWITTLSVAPYCLSLVSLAAYFVSERHRRLPGYIHAMIIAQVALLAYNAFLSANRGVFFWLLTYWLFHLFFVRGFGVRTFLTARALRVPRLAFIAVLAVSLSYIYFIARYRSSEMYLTYLVSTEGTSLRYSLPDIDTPALGALISLMQYGTHEYGFIDAFLERADPVAFNPGYLLGSRVLDQVRRVVPGYETQGEIVAGRWISDAGLAPWAWPSVFGWLLALFGYLGAPLFLAGLGFTYGRLAREYLWSGSFGSLVIVFSLYTALNMSFNWIGGDLQQNTGYLVGLGLLLWRRQAPR
ncbi:MAG TPA: hypothetical protein PKZ08_01875 [Vicinamibacterales bacterium]|nr:hypothetical protein [Vicinamibacterales bacterium]